MKYGFTLTPTKVVGRDTKLTIKMRPTKPDVAPKKDVAPAEVPVIPPPPCVTRCDGILGNGWTSSASVASLVSGDTSTIMAMANGPWTVRLDFNGVLCDGDVLTWTFTGDLVENTDFYDVIQGLTLWLFGPKIDGYPDADLFVQANINGVPFCDPFQFHFTAGIVGTDYWDVSPVGYGIFYGWQLSDPGNLNNHLTFTDARGPLGGVGISIPFSLITQTSGSAWITPPYLVDNGDGTFALWFDTMDPTDLALTWSYALSFYDTGGSAYGDPLIANYGGP